MIHGNSPISGCYKQALPRRAFHKLRSRHSGNVGHPISNRRGLTISLTRAAGTARSFRTGGISRHESGPAAVHHSFLIELSSRRVQIGGISASANGQRGRRTLDHRDRARGLLCPTKRRARAIPLARAAACAGRNVNRGLRTRRKEMCASRGAVIPFDDTNFRLPMRHPTECGRSRRFAVTGL